MDFEVPTKLYMKDKPKARGVSCCVRFLCSYSNSSVQSVEGSSGINGS
jgi:hypothetical protein